MTQAESVLPRFAIRTRPEDFVVVEEPLYPASGVGAHLFVEIEKRGRTTEQVARDLARGCGVSPRDVGYAGRKDRHAVTRQWFSLPDVEPSRAMGLELMSARVLSAVRHEHKLKTGHLHGNRFEIVVSSDQPVDLPTLETRARELVRRGMPNRYGEQRFGRSGDNAEAARKLFRAKSVRGDLRAARFLVSALQAEVFNAVLAERIERYDDVALGDLARVEASGGLFWVDDLERERPRARDFEISATGPIFGTKVREPRGEIADLEAKVFERHGIPPAGELVLPRGLRAHGTRRPLRVLPRDLALTALAEGRGFRLVCGLPPGAYVTILLESLVGSFGVLVDASRTAASPDESFDAGVSSDEPTRPDMK